MPWQAKGPNVPELPRAVGTAPSSRSLWTLLSVIGFEWFCVEPKVGLDDTVIPFQLGRVYDSRIL